MKRETLDKSISFRSYIAIGLGTIIGIGWVIYAGYWLRDGGPVGAMLAFILCGLFLLPVGKCYAELTAAIPVAGGEAAFAYKAFGPFVSFLTACALALSYIAITPFETIAIGALVEAMFPALISEPLYQMGGYTIRVSNLLPGIILGALLILLNCRGARSSTGFQTLVLAILALCALVFISVALLKGDLVNLTPMFASGGASWVAAPASIIPVLVVAPYFMAGFDTIPQAAEEAGVSMAPHRIGVAILACIVLGALFYALIILALGMSSTPGQLAAIMQDRDAMPTAEIFRLAFGYEWAAQLVLFAALLGLLTTLNGIYIASSRLLFFLGRGGMLPHWFAKVDARHRMPVNALLFVGAISLLGPPVGRAALVPIVTSGSLAFVAALLLTCLAAVRLRTTAPDMNRPYRTGKSTMYCGIVVSGILVLLMVVPGSPGQLRPQEFAIIGIWMCLGVAGYCLRRSLRDMEPSQQRYLILGEEPHR